MKYFCSNCGKTTQYGIELPKFCAYCGQSFANKPAPIEVDEQRNRFLNELKLKKNINSVVIEEDIEEPINTNINFKKIKPSFKVDIYKNKGESLGSLIDNPSEVLEINDTNQTRIKTKEEILENFKKEAGSLREKE